MNIFKLLVYKIKEEVNCNFVFHLMIKKIIRRINKDIINFIEIGTAFGDSSTKVIYKELNKSSKNFQLIGFEPIDEIFKSADSRWKNVVNVKILKNYFLSEQSINFLIEVIKREIKDDSILQNNIDNYLNIRPENFVDKKSLPAPSIIFIDSIRYSHVAILNTIWEFGMNDAIIIMEDDIPGYGELKIIEKYFSLHNLQKIRCYPHQWPYISFTFDKKNN